MDNEIDLTHFIYSWRWYIVYGFILLFPVVWVLVHALYAMIRTFKSKSVYGSAYIQCLYALLGCICACVTWYYIVCFILDVFHEYPTIHEALRNGEVFVRAYEVDTYPSIGFWWSSQLLLQVPAIVLAILVWSQQLHKHFSSTVPHTIMYIAVGFLGAISAMLSWFLATTMHIILMDLNQRKDGKSKSHKNTTSSNITTASAVSFIAAIGSILFMPYAQSYFRMDGFESYAHNLYLMHVFLAAPAIIEPFSRIFGMKPSVSGVTLLRILSIICTCSYWFVSLRVVNEVISGDVGQYNMANFATSIDISYIQTVVKSLHDQCIGSSGNTMLCFSNLIYAGFAHNSQAGISWDAVFCWIILPVFLTIVSITRGDNIIRSFIRHSTLPLIFGTGGYFSWAIADILQQNK